MARKWIVVMVVERPGSRITYQLVGDHMFSRMGDGEPQIFPSKAAAQREAQKHDGGRVGEWS